eukprot:GHVR01019931.1.p1 GENE.GHVR01019931.1~~GHVR01019931.1.p1  ORF type:complete len:214 (-),score=30.13 GHVR01019931.1:256-897(-)
MFFRTVITNYASSYSLKSRNVFQCYSKYLQRYPVAVKTASAFIIGGCADTTAQRLSGKQIKYNYERTIVWGSLTGGLAFPLHYWYNWLSYKRYIIIHRLLIDQIVASVGVNITYLFAMPYLVKKKNAKEALSIATTKLPKAMLYNVLLWVPVQYLNFTYVPVILQLLVINIVQLIWCSFVSVLASTDRSKIIINNDDTEKIIINNNDEHKISE